MHTSLEYAFKRLQELEGILLVGVPEVVWPVELAVVFTQVENAGNLPAHY